MVRKMSKYTTLFETAIMSCMCCRKLRNPPPYVEGGIYIRPARTDFASLFMIAESPS